MNFWSWFKQTFGPQHLNVSKDRKFQQTVSKDPKNTRFDHIMIFIMKWECDYPNDTSGQYSNDPNDPGGPTKWGIDLRGQREQRPNENWTEEKIKSLTYDEALAIYKDQYWDTHNCQIYSIGLGEVYFNTWVNGGEATKWIRQCEGDAKKYLSLQEQYYTDLVNRKPNLKRYLQGWLNRTADLKTFLNL